MDVGLLLAALAIVAAAGVGWSIGANDAANSIGTAVGSRAISLRQAIIQVSIFGFLGALLQGGHVSATIGKGIVPIRDLAGYLPTCVALVASVSACCWVALATYWKMPVSTSHSIVGAVAGAGLAVHAPVQWKVLGDILICWIGTPLGAAALGYLVLSAVNRLFTRVLPPRFSARLLRVLIVASGWYVAYSWGANDVANSVGVVSGAGIMSPGASVILGGLAIVLGIVTWGYRVIETIGSNITNLVPVMAFSAQIASAVNVHVYTLMGVPVSTSHSIVGAIFGVGLFKGMKVVNLRILKEIVICWLATPVVSGVASFLILKFLVQLLKLQC